MNKSVMYEVDFIGSKILLSKKFHKAASILNSNEYTILMQLRRDNPGFQLELREIKKKDGKKSYRHLTYQNMRDYIITRDGKDSDALTEFDRVLTLSKVQSGPYAYVKTWFLNRYKDEFESEADTQKATDAPADKPDLKLIAND